MATFLVGYNLYCLYFFTDPVLSAMVYTESQKLTITWLLKSMMITTYVFCEFFAKTYFNRMDLQKVLLKIWLILEALEAAWVDVWVNYPNFLVAFLFLEIFVFTIGPLIDSPRFVLYSLRDIFAPPLSTRLTSDFTITLIFQMIYKLIRPSLLCLTPIVTLIAIFYRDAVADQKKFESRLLMESLQQAVGRTEQVD